jgi:hypothetical protein
MFLVPISMIALSAQLVVRVADVVPEFDIARGCRLDSAETCTTKMSSGLAHAVGWP